MQTYPTEALQLALINHQSGMDRDDAIAAALEQCVEEGLILFYDDYMMLQVRNAMWRTYQSIQTAGMA